MEMLGISEGLLERDALSNGIVPSFGVLHVYWPSRYREGFLFACSFA